MSIWNSDQRNSLEDSSEFVTDFSKKAISKIDSTSKLQVIQAIEDGQSKSDIAQEYGVHPQVIAQIYKHKDSLIKKFTQKYNLLKQFCSLSLEQKLLEWFNQQLKCGKVVTEECLHDKASDILKPLNDEFTCLSDWLYSFRMRHGISEYCPDEESKSEVEWRKFISNFDSTEVYLGGVCALSYNFDINSFLNGQETDNYLSLLLIVNALGTDKRELAVVGKDLLENEEHVRSLPVTYYYCSNGQVNHSVISSYLTKWDSELASKDKNVTLIFNVPDSLIRSMKFGNIKIVSTTELCYATNIVEKAVECFKYHYRRLQISRTLTYGKDNCSFLDYVHMIGMAWYNIPQRYLQNLSLLPGQGLYYSIREDEGDHSLLHWCKNNSIPLNLEECSSLDKYIFCDKKLPCIYCGQLEEHMRPIEIITEKSCESTSGMEAYQAMKRLISYLQGESADASIMKYAKYLENHLEYGALLQMHQIIASTNDSI